MRRASELLGVRATAAKAVIRVPACTGSSGGNSSTPEGSRKHLKPTTPPRPQRLEVVEIVRHGAAPEGHVDAGLALRRLLLDPQRGDVDRRRARC